MFYLQKNGMWLIFLMQSLQNERIVTKQSGGIRVLTVVLHQILFKNLQNTEGVFFIKIKPNLL
jgi:hypothetical protein